MMHPQVRFWLIPQRPDRRRRIRGRHQQQKRPSHLRTSEAYQDHRGLLFRKGAGRYEAVFVCLHRPSEGKTTNLNHQACRSQFRIQAVFACLHTQSEGKTTNLNHQACRSPFRIQGVFACLHTQSEGETTNLNHQACRS